MPNIDYSHLNKFIASMGLILIAMAFIVPWLFSQSTAVLTISEKELDEMTGVSRGAITERQTALATFQDQALPLVSLSLLAVGLLALIVGLVRWNSRQKLRDVDEDYELAAKRGAFEKATDEEVADKVQEEADREEVPVTPNSLARSGNLPGATQPAPQNSSKDRIALLRERESELEQKVRRAFNAEFSINKDVRLVSQSGPSMIIDLLLDPIENTSWSQLAIDLRFVRSRMLTMRSAEIVMRTAIATNDLRGGLVYSGRPGRPAMAKTTALNIFVVEDDEEFTERHLFRVREYLRATNVVLKRPIGSVIMTSAKFQEISSDELRDAISTSWKSGDTILIE